MARRRKGSPVDGWLVVDKPLGVTSSDIVNKARWALQAQKAGHSGTLDPLASGCLAVAFGEATKTIPHAQEGAKTYRFTVCWGAATATDDLEGEVIARSPDRPERAEVEAVLARFTGVIRQVPPQFSAVKVDGARAYDLARRGEVPELAAREIRVDRLDLRECPDADHAVFEMVCGKGGYVRSIARDLGAALGCLGHVTALRRLATGPFDLSRAVAFEALDGFRDTGIPPEMQPLAAGLSGMVRVDITPMQAADLRLGRAVECGPGDGAAWAACDGQAIAIGLCEGGVFRPRRVIVAPGG
ncbi:MAG: tRNA pseudouridine(55) synthase TruB [Pseudomonadota bacterium]